jgi:sulfur relay (sulfurtransferase) complex TusBCD TusD component (DsrE family)
MGMAVSNPHFNKVSGDYDRGRVSEDIWFWAGEAEMLAHLVAGVERGTMMILANWVKESDRVVSL